MSGTYASEHVWKVPRTKKSNVLKKERERRDPVTTRKGGRTTKNSKVHAMLASGHTSKAAKALSMVSLPLFHLPHTHPLVASSIYVQFFFISFRALIT